MKIKDNGTGSYCINLNKKYTLFIRKKGHKLVRFFFPEAPGIHKFAGYRNLRFKLSKHCLIRIPFFYFETSNSGYSIGNHTIYLRKVNLSGKAKSR